MDFICRQCGIEKLRIWAGKIQKCREGNKKVYVDKEDRRWNGHQCPDCFYPKKVKEPEEELLGPELKYSKPQHRNCRKCSLTLERTKYFYCAECAPAPNYCNVFEMYGLVDNGSF